MNDPSARASHSAQDALNKALAERWGSPDELHSAWWQTQLQHWQAARLSWGSEGELLIRPGTQMGTAVVLQVGSGPKTIHLGLPMPSAWAADGAQWENSAWRDVILFDRLQPLLRQLAVWSGTAVALPAVNWSAGPASWPARPCFALPLRWHAGQQVCDIDLAFSDPALAALALTAFARANAPTADEPAPQAESEPPGPATLDRRGPLLELRPWIPTPALTAVDRQYLGIGAGLLAGDIGGNRWTMCLRVGQDWCLAGTVAVTGDGWQVVDVDLDPLKPPPFGLRRWAKADEGLFLLGLAWRISLGELLGLRAGHLLPPASNYGLVILDGQLAGTATPAGADGRIWRINGWHK